MALWFISYATSPITVTIYDVSIVIVYDVTLLLSMTYQFQSRLGKTDCTDIWVIKLGPPLLSTHTQLHAFGYEPSVWSMNPECTGLSITGS